MGAQVILGGDDGLQIDFGGVIASVRLDVKGAKHLHPVVFCFGAPVDTDESERVVKPSAWVVGANKEASFRMDMQADKKVTVSPGDWKDEAGNPVEAPAGATAVYTVDDNTIVTVNPIDDLTSELVATGALGSTLVHGEVSFNGMTKTADGSITVVAGDADRFELVFGEPTEVTPDEPTTPEEPPAEPTP